MELINEKNRVVDFSFGVLEILKYYLNILVEE